MLDWQREVDLVWCGRSSLYFRPDPMPRTCRFLYQDRLRQCKLELNALKMMDGEIVEALNNKAFRTARGPQFSGGMVYPLRQKWRIPIVKTNGTAANLEQWSDGSYSMHGAAAIIGITQQVIFDRLPKGWLTGK